MVHSGVEADVGSRSSIIEDLPASRKRMNRLQAGAVAFVMAIAALGTAQGVSDKNYFTVLQTGFSFVIPKTWKAQNLKREQRITIPTAGNHGPAVMHFYTVDFRYKTSDWQDTQIAVATEFKRTVDRQWQEEVLGIPLVLTKTSGLDSKGVPDVVLTGLLYSATKNKLLFRLTCPAEDFDSANTAWREAFQTLRTVDGSTAQPDDPNRKLSPDQLEAKPNGVLPVTSVGTTTHVDKVRKGSVVVRGTAGGKGALIHLGQKWAADPQKDGTWLVSSHELVGKVVMTLASNLDSDPVATALLKASGQALERFVAVKDRTDVADERNAAGATVNAVTRVGTSAKGPLTSFDAAVSSGDLYVMFHWESGAALTAGQRKALSDLIAQATVDAAP